MKHTDVWAAIDRLAKEYGLSPSGLARKAGLDPTTFNKSKRVTREGKLRWPSTESLAKILDATGAELSEFMSYLDRKSGGGVVRNIPVIGLAQAGKGGHFDDAGYPAGGGWDEIPFPGVGDANAFSVEITGDSMEPLYRDGDRVVVSPSANIRRGDRVVLKTTAGEVMAKELIRQTANKVDLRSINAEHGDLSIAREEIEWMWRILWASQ